MRMLRRRCLLVALLVAAVTLAGPSVAAAATGVYGGELTKTDDPLVLVTNAAGTRITSVVAGWSASCASGVRATWHTPVKAVPHQAGMVRIGVFDVTYRRGGRFTAEFRWGQDLQGSAGSRVISMTLAGRLGRSAASGTFSGDLSDTDVPWLSPTLPEKVTRLDRCATGTLAWKAARKAGTVYGGLTAQGEAIVIVRSADGRAVKGFHIGWHSDCTPDGYLDSPETFGGGSITGGAFAGVLRRTGSGGLVIDYALRGTLRRTAGSGTFRAKATVPDGHACDTGSQSWSVTSG